jgi:phospholipid transport system transporter-binding protein
MIEADEEGWRISGPLTIATAVEALEEGERLWPPKGWGIDVAGLTHADSAALSVLLSWQRRARAESARLRVLNLPPALRSLATLYGVEEFIGAQAAAS